jgi:hypothetical protein
MDGKKHLRILLLLPILALGCAQANAGRTSTRSLIKQLANDELAPSAAASLITIGKSAISPLSEVVVSHESMVARGWAVVAVARIGGSKAKTLLDKWSTNSDLPELVRTWSAAARTNGQPALKKPWNKQALKVLQESGTLDGGDLTTMLELVNSNRQLASAVAPAIIKQPTKKLAKLMFTSKNNNLRRQAASYLGSKANKEGVGEVAPELVKLYRYSTKRGKKGIFWKGGGLFVPGIQWPRPQARKLMFNLIQWLQYTEGQGMRGESRQLMNNLRSVSLHRQAGIRVRGHRPQDYFRLLEEL